MAVLKIGLVKEDTSESFFLKLRGKAFGTAEVNMSWGEKPVVSLFNTSRWISIWHTTEDTLVYWHFPCRNSHTLQSLVSLWLSCWACKNRMFKSCPIWWHAVYCSDDWLQALAGFHFLLWVGYGRNLYQLLGWGGETGSQWRVNPQRGFFSLHEFNTSAGVRFLCILRALWFKLEGYFRIIRIEFPSNAVVYIFGFIIILIYFNTFVICPELRLMSLFMCLFWMVAICRFTSRLD